MGLPTRVSIALVVAALVVLAGCNGGGTTATPTATTTTATPTTTATTTTTTTTATPTTATATPTTTTTDGDGTPADPPDDRLGWEGGYWYTEALSLTPEDGYDRAELDRIVARTMARLEVVRELEFEDEVSVEVISREEYRERNVFEFEPDPWRDQVYEALFVVGEDTHASEALQELYGGSVAGYYAGGKIVLVSDDPDSVQVDRATLAHELVHALQDQHLSARPRGTSMDARTALRGIIEGEANYLMDRYQERCRGEWECIGRPPRTNATPSYNRGLFLTVFVPYSDGPALVGDLFERGGWDRVDRAYDRPPVSTEQVIHPEKYPAEGPVRVEVEDRSGDGWRRFSRQRRTTQRVGEAALYAMFWHNGVVPEDHLRTDETRYNYSHPLTAGWGGDVVVPYRDGDRFGYVFKSRWDTERDAREFYRAYLDLLDSKGSNKVRSNVYVIPDEEPFGDAFRVVRSGRTVTVVNAPTVDDLDEVHRPK